MWLPMLPAGVRIKHETYTVAGVIVGERGPVRRALQALHPPFLEMMTHVSKACGVHSQACLTAVRLSYTPVTKYGHHLSSHPPDDTEAVAQAMRTTMLESAETMLHIPSGSLTASPPDVSADHRFFDATADGGCGFSDPHVHRYSAFVASFVNSLPLILTNPHLRPVVVDTGRWPKSRSRILRALHVLIQEFALLAKDHRNSLGGQTEGTGMSHSPKFTVTLSAAVDAHGTISVESHRRCISQRYQ